jgi:hypothetical protein
MNTSQIIHGNSNNGTSISLGQAINELYADITTLKSQVVIINDIAVLTLPADYPIAVKGQKWRVTAGQIGGTGPILEDGDLLIAIADSPIAGSHALYGANFIAIEKDIAPSTVAILRTGTSVVDYVTPASLVANGETRSSATVLALAGGTTQQLSLTSTAAQKGLYIAQTASTGRAIDIVSQIADATTRIISVATGMNAAFTTAKTLDGYYFTHTSNGTDVTGAEVNGASVYLGNTALSKISFNGYKVDLAGSYTAAGGSQSIVGFYMRPSITIDSATTTLSGIYVSLTGVTRTNASSIYAGRFVTASTATSAILASNSSNTVDICNGTTTLNLSGTATTGILLGGTLTTGISIGACTTGITFTGLVSGNAIDFGTATSVTGSLIDYIGIDGKTSGYLFNGSMTTSVLDASTLIDDFGCTCAHDGLAADTLRGTRRIWSGAMPNGTAAPEFILAEYQFNSVFGSGAAIGGSPKILSLYSSATINDSAANFTAFNIDLSSMTLTLANNVYGVNIISKAGVDAVINVSGTGSKGINFDGFTMSQGQENAMVSIGTWTTPITVTGQTEHFAPIQVNLASNSTIAKNITAARFRVDTVAANTLTAVYGIQVRNAIAHDVASAYGCHASMNLGTMAVITGAIAVGSFYLEGTGTITPAGSNPIDVVNATNVHSGTGVSNVLNVCNNTASAVGTVSTMSNLAGVVTDMLYINNANTATSAIHITAGTLTNVINVAGAATASCMILVDAATASTCVAPNTSAINALTAKIAVKIMVGGSVYWIPAFSCTDGTGATFN